jgi:hypothetical protein
VEISQGKQPGAIKKERGFKTNTIIFFSPSWEKASFPFHPGRS